MLIESSYKRINFEPVKVEADPIFKYIDDSQNYLFRTKKHKRYKSQPTFEEEDPQPTHQHIRLKSQLERGLWRNLSQKPKFANSAKGAANKANLKKGKKFEYNKWFIKPENRLKQKVDTQSQTQKPVYTNSEKQAQKYYEKLFTECETPVEEQDLPSTMAHQKQNRNIAFAREFRERQKGSVGLLQEFRWTLENKKATRCPKIVDLVLTNCSKKQSQKLVNNLISDIVNKEASVQQKTAQERCQQRKISCFMAEKENKKASNLFKKSSTSKKQLQVLRNITSSANKRSSKLHSTRIRVSGYD